MHKTILNAASALLAVAISGSLFTTTTEAKVVVVQAGSPVLAAGSSYAWAPASGTVIGQTDPMLANEVTGARLRFAIESALAGHGYRRADVSPRPTSPCPSVSCSGSSRRRA